MSIDRSRLFRHRALVESLRVGVLTISSQESDLRMRAAVHWSQTQAALPHELRGLSPADVLDRLTADAADQDLNRDARSRINGLLTAVSEYLHAESEVLQLQREKTVIESRYRPLAALQANLERYAAEQGVTS